MPDKYEGKWDDGITTLTWDKLYEMKERFVELYNLEGEAVRMLARYVAELGIVFFGHVWESDFSKDEIEKWRGEI